MDRREESVMLSIDHDRRDGDRIVLSRPCKIYNPKSHKYIAGTTCDVSFGGLLIRLDRSAQVETGDCLYVGIAQKRRQTLLRSSDMIRTRVVRSLSSTTGQTMLGLQFTDPSQKLLWPLRRAA